MPTFYNYTENGVAYSFDDIFVPADAFRQGNLWAWGNNSYGQLGDNTATQRNTPVTTFSGGANWKQVSSNGYVMGAIKTDGTLWMCGGQVGNTNGMLGDNTTISKSTPVTTFAGGTNWKQVACGRQHTTAIKADGTLWAWGNNAFGQLGVNDTNNRTTPVTTFVGGTNWKTVAFINGYGYTSAIKTDGTLWTWGQNAYGQLGVNDITNRLTPVTTFAGGTNWKQVSCSIGNTKYISAFKTDGTLWTWGRNNLGQLGVNDTTDRSTPVTTFAGGTNWKQVSCGYSHTTAIKTDGTLWTWGDNTVGQLGVNDTNNRTTPVTTFAGGTNWKQTAGGGFHTAVIKTDGTLWIWGSNGNGAIGVNDTNNRTTPVTTFAGGTNWKQVVGGRNHTSAVTYIDDYQ